MDTNAYENGTTAAMTVPTVHHNNKSNGLVAVQQQYEHKQKDPIQNDAEAMNGSTTVSIPVLPVIRNGSTKKESSSFNHPSSYTEATYIAATDTNGNHNTHGATVGTTLSTIQMNGTSTTTTSSIRNSSSSTCHTDSKDIGIDDTFKLPPVTAAANTTPPPTTTLTAPSVTIASDRVTFTDDAIIANYT
jgi:hypothetical protein